MLWCTTDVHPNVPWVLTVLLVVPQVVHQKKTPITTMVQRMVLLIFVDVQIRQCRGASVVTLVVAFVALFSCNTCTSVVHAMYLSLFELYHPGTPVAHQRVRSGAHLGVQQSVHLTAPQGVRFDVHARQPTNNFVVHDDVLLLCHHCHKLHVGGTSNA